MRLSKSLVINLIISAVLLLVCPFSLQAATKKKVTKPQKFTTIGVNGKKLQCVKMPGRKFEPGKLRGTIFLSDIAKAQADLRRARKTVQKRKAKNSLALAKKNQKICRIGYAVPTPTPTPLPTVVPPDPTAPPFQQPDPYPIPSALQPYGGEVSDAAITRLLNVGGLGSGALEESIVQTAKSQGLTAAVDQLFTFQPEPAEFAACDGWLNGANDGTAITAGNLTVSGMRYWHFCQAIRTVNPAKFNLALYLMELTPVDSNFSDQTEYQTWVSYWRDLLMAYAANLNLTNFLIDMGRHPRMLDFLNNNGNRYDPRNKKDLSNENYARELQQLFTLGPVYTDTSGQQQLSYVEGRIDPSTQAFNLKLGDHPRVAAIFSGWIIQNLPASDGSGNKPTAVFNSAVHNPNVQKVYEGTPWEIDTNKDDQFIIQLLAKHPAAPLFAAERLLKYYVTPYPDLELIRGLAQIILQNNYNLSAVVPILLKSNAFYSDISKNTLPVSSFKAAVKLVKALHIENNIAINTVVGSIDQSYQITNPDGGVFGWDKARFNNGSVLPLKVNLAASVLEQGFQRGWTVDAFTPTGVVTSPAMVNAILARFGINLSSTEIDFFIKLFNNDMNSQGVNTAVTYDNNNAARKAKKVAGMVRAIQGLPQWNFN